MAKKKYEVKDYSFITIQGWMLNRLDMSGTELIIYSIIYGFSQEKNQWCSASQEYLAEWSNSSLRTVKRVLESFVESGHIIKRYRTNEIGRYCEYKAIVPENVSETKCQNDTMTKCQNVQTKCQNDTYQSAILSSDTIKDKIDNNIDNNIGDKSPAPASKTRFVKPTVDEIAAYCRERNNHVDAQYFFDYYEGNGWKRGKTPLKDWKATVRTWERNSYSNSGRSTCGNNNPAGFDEMFD